MSSLPESTVTARGQTTLPAAVRKALGVKPGEKIRYLIGENGEVRIRKTRSVMEMAGFLARPGQPVLTLEEMDQAIADGAAGLP